MGDFVAFSEEIEDGMKFLEHHGILGQRWGLLKGPPYPLGRGDHSAREKRLAKRAGVKVGKDSGKGSAENLSGGSTSSKPRSKSPMTEEEKREAALDAARKGDKKKIAKYMDYLTREELQEAENRARIKDNMTRVDPSEKKMSKADMEKMEAIQSGDKEKVKQFADKMTYAELQEAMNKVNLTERLNYVEPKPTISDKINNVMNKVAMAKDWAEKGIDAYNTLAKVYNSTHPDSEGWPEIRENTKLKKREMELTAKLANQAKNEVKKELTDKEIAKRDLERAKLAYDNQQKLNEYKQADQAKKQQEADKEAKKQLDSDWSDAIAANRRFDKAKAKEEKAREQETKQRQKEFREKFDKDREEAYAYNKKLNDERLERDWDSANKENAEYNKNKETQRLIDEGRKYDDYTTKNWNPAKVKSVKETKMSDYSDQSYDDLISSFAPSYKEAMNQEYKAKERMSRDDDYYQDLYSSLYDDD